MWTRKRCAVLTFALLAPLGACGGDAIDERAALEDEELARELDLALQGDTLAPTFEDSAVADTPADDPTPAPTPTPARSTPRPQPTPPPPAPAPREEPRYEAPRPRTVVRTAPVGTTFAVRLDETLGTDRNAPGDGFTATLTDAIYGGDGRVVVPAGATIRGRVTHVDRSDRVGETAVIKLAFESVAFGGESYPLQGSVVEANPERRNRTSGKTTAAKIAGGAAAGAILGQVLGKDTESTLKGAVVGAAAGTAIAMGTADVDAVLPQGSRMVVRLDAPIEVVRTVS